MKLDEILLELERIIGGYPGEKKELTELVYELAQHVKAQEPEELTEEEVLLLKSEDEALENQSIGAAIRKVADGLKR